VLSLLYLSGINWRSAACLVPAAEKWQPQRLPDRKQENLLQRSVGRGLRPCHSATLNPCAPGAQSPRPAPAPPPAGAGLSWCGLHRSWWQRHARAAEDQSPIGSAASGDGYDRFAAGVTGAAKRADNILLARGTGLVAGGLTAVFSGGTAAVAAPMAGAAVGTGVAMRYNTSNSDRAVDGFVGETLGRAEPYLASGSRYVGSALSSASDWAYSTAVSAFGK
jgi:hypothetical protein